MITSDRAWASIVIVRRLDQAVVAPDLDPPRGGLEVEVGHADEDRVGDRRWRACGPRGPRSPGSGCPSRRRRGGPGSGRRPSSSAGPPGRRRWRRGPRRRRTGSPAAGRGRARRRGRPRLTVGRIDSIACRTRPRSLVPVATIRAVRPASITLTLPPLGQVLERLDRGLLGGGEPIRRDVRGGHARRRIDDQDDVAGQTGRPLDERPSREEREDRRRAAAGAGTGGSAGASATARWPRHRRRAAARAASRGRPSRSVAAGAGTSRRRPARTAGRAARAGSRTASAQPASAQDPASAELGEDQVVERHVRRQVDVGRRRAARRGARTPPSRPPGGRGRRRSSRGRR